MADPHFGLVHLIKVDISDRFYRVALNINDIPKLAVAVPSLPHKPPLLAVPLTLLMGWMELPPYFCTAIGTVADLANQCLYSTPGLINSNIT